MKMMQGAFFLPWVNRSRTREAPTPTNISTKSEPLMEKKGTPASPAMARAMRVLPVPGPPTNSTPLGMRPPRRVNFLGSRKNSMISVSSSLASSTPATSSKVMRRPSGSVCSRARLLPKLMALPPPICIWRMKKIHMPIRRSMGNQETRMDMYHGESSSGFTVIFTSLALRSLMSLGSSGA